MKTFSEFPRCERHALLRTLRNGNVVVSSAALEKHLGPKYQEFIERNLAVKQPLPPMGFWPQTVEAFLKNGKREK